MKNLKYIPLIFAAIFCLSLTNSFINQPLPTKKDNVIVFLLDDCGWEVLDTNNLEYNTPVFDSLADAGVRYTRAFVKPSCTPTRLCLEFGQSVFHTYRYFSLFGLKLRGFGSIAQAYNYVTAKVGKFHNTGWDNLGRPNFDKTLERATGWNYTFSSNGAIETSSYYRNTKFYDNRQDTIVITGATYSPDTLQHYALKWLKEQVTANKQFFMYYNFNLPHFQFVAPRDHPDFPSTSEDTAYFKPMIEFADMQVGVFVDSLKSWGVLDSTILIFIGDNGTDTDIFTEHADGNLQGGKASTNRQGMNVPYIVYWGRKNATVRNHVVSSLVTDRDIYATICQHFAQNTQVLYGDETDPAISHYHTWNADYEIPDTLRTYETLRDRLANGTVLADWGEKVISDKYIMKRLRGETAVTIYDYRVDYFNASPLDTSLFNAAEMSEFWEMYSELDKYPLTDIND